MLVQVASTVLERCRNYANLDKDVNIKYSALTAVEFAVSYRGLAVANSASIEAP